jgi:hypothetical protein
MTSPSHLVAYIDDCRKQSISDVSIRSDLLDQGYPALLIDTLLEGKEPVHRPAEYTHRHASFTHPEGTISEHTEPEASILPRAEKELQPIQAGRRATSLSDTAPDTSTTTPPVAAAVAPSKRTWHRRSTRALLICGAVTATVLAVGCWVLASRPEHEAAAKPVLQSVTVKDQNYTIVLPKDWAAGSDYNNGAGVNVYYQPGNMTVRKSRMAVFVVPKDSKSADYVSTQIAGLRQNGGTATIIGSQSVTLNGTIATITQVRSTAASNPDDATYYMYMTTVYGNTQYAINVMIPDEQWSANKAGVMDSLKSFRPSNPAVTHRQPAAN